MYKEEIEFKSGCPVAYDAWQLGTYHLHCHKGVIEVLMVLEGKAYVKSSFEEFELDEGDYIVIREKDPHSFSAAESQCTVVSLYFRMDDYKKQIPYIDDIYFACESFDLAKYRNETALLRRMVSLTICALAKNDDTSVKNAEKNAEVLLWTLAHNYDMITYYNRNWNVSYNKVEKYYKIMRHIMENFSTKNLPEHISKKEHYSRSYVVHIFKEVGGSSFKDMLDLTRLSHSETMLLDSDIPVSAISDLCGYSDVKYYIKSFKKWFLTTPADYRKKFQPEVNKQSVYTYLDDDMIVRKLEKYLYSTTENTEYKAAITPISVKTLSTRADSIKFNGAFSAECFSKITKHASSADDVKHSIVFALNDKLSQVDKDNLFAQTESFAISGLEPVFIADMRDMSSARCKASIEECAGYFVKTGSYVPTILIIYNDLGEYDSINTFISQIKERHNYNKHKLLPLFIP